MLNEKQAEIIRIDRSYVQKFIKISSYLKTKRNNIQTLFKSLEETSNEMEFENKETFLKGQIYSYQLLLFHSISMITALLNDNMVVFYEVYEAFDKLSIFNSNWESEVSQKLSTINRKLDDLIKSVNKVEYAISEGLENLSYTTQNSFEKFQSSIDEQLANIDSSVRVNNLLGAIQIYQMYKVNRHTRRIQ